MKSGVEEKLWWVTYRRKCDIEAGRDASQGNAFFYAYTEEEARAKVAGWQRYIKHHTVVVETLLVQPHGFQLHIPGTYFNSLPTIEEARHQWALEALQLEMNS